MKGRRATASEAGWPRTILFLAAPDTQILDVAGPFQVFFNAARLFVRNHPGQAEPYRVLMASCTGQEAVQTDCGLLLTGTETFSTYDGPIDTLLVAGGSGIEEAALDEELLRWLRATAPRVRRIGSICTGAFLLAAAGLLDGKRVATHWKVAEALAKKFRRITVEVDPIYVRDGNTYTTAGITAGMDLALALVEEDLGSALALEIARVLILYLRRTGGQSQFSTALALQASDRKQIEEVRAWIIENLHRELTVETLAAKAGMSSRSFARVFHKTVETTPAKYVERLRVETARRRLEESADKIDKVARDCGFASVQALRRAFLRVLHVGPNDYRSRFSDLAQSKTNKPQSGNSTVRARAISTATIP